MSSDVIHGRGDGIKAVLPSFLRRLSRRVKTVIRDQPNRRRTAGEVFGKIYAENLWGTGEGDFYSGPGSGPQAAQPYADFVKQLIADKNIQTVVDLGCGDFRVGGLIAPSCITYTGVDVVRPVIDRNTQAFGNDRVRFECLDITADKLPDGELCLIREVLQHLSNTQIKAILARIRKYRFVLITDIQPGSARGYRINRDKIHGASSRLAHRSILRLDLPPFNVMNVQQVLETRMPESAVDGVDGDGFVLRTFLIAPSAPKAPPRRRRISRRPAELPPTVVVGANLNGLGLVRSLHRGGMPIFVLDTSHWQPAMWSLGCHPVLVQAFDRPIVDDLLRLRERFDQDPLLFLANELSVFAVSEARNELAGYRFRMPPDRMVVALSDKIALQRLAEDGGFAVPKTLCLETMADLAGLDRIAFPAVVKPADKHCLYNGQSARIHRADDLAQTRTICAALLNNSVRLVVQEWIPGDDSQIYFCLFYCGRPGDAPVSMFTGRKILSHPRGVGSTGICIAAPEAKDALEPLTRRFIDLVGFEGLGSLEFKWHPDRREFLMIEPTVGRTDWQEEVATLCGENIPLAAYCHELGLPPPQKRPGRAIWRENFRRAWPAELPRDGASLYDGYWRITDPGPGIAHYLEETVRRITPLGRRISTGALNL